MSTEIKKVILGLKQAKENAQNRNYRMNQGIDFICKQNKEIKDLVRKLEKILIEDKSCVYKVGQIKSLIGMKL